MLAARRFFFGLLSLAASACAPAFAPPPEVRDAVSAALTEGGLDAAQLLKAKDLFTTADLSSQSAPDIIVDYNATPSGKYCGTGGCPLEVWVKIGATPYRKAFDLQAFGYAVNIKANRTWLEVDVHGVHCGGTGSDTCAYAFEWKGAADDPAGVFEATSIFGKPDHYDGPLLQALPFDMDAAPIEVSSAVEHTEAFCRMAGGVGDASATVSWGPDLTSDERREIVFDGRFATCVKRGEPRRPACVEDTCGTIVYIAPPTPDGAWVKGYSSAIAQAYDFDFASGTPRMRLTEPCTSGNCPRRSLVWFPDEGQLK